MELDNLFITGFDYSNSPSFNRADVFVIDYKHVQYIGIMLNILKPY